MGIDNKSYSRSPLQSSSDVMGRRGFSRSKKTCPLSGKDAPEIDYKNIKLLQKFTSERGKIFPRRITSVSSIKQRQLAKAIKRARSLALMPYTTN